MFYLVIGISLNYGCFVSSSSHSGCVSRLTLLLLIGACLSNMVMKMHVHFEKLWFESDYETLKVESVWANSFRKISLLNALLHRYFMALCMCLFSVDLDVMRVKHIG